jgi:predicted DsbA family dithiol-disulfide isomerase
VSEPIKVDVWSDVACPWCYIGKRNFEAAVAQLASDPEPVAVDVEYHSFQLQPDMPADFAGSEVDYLVERKGVAEAQARAMIDRVTTAARAVGLDYDFDAIQPANTGKAHELLHYAKARGHQAEVKERLLRAHFVEGRHVGRDADLAELAAEAGLDRDDALRSLREGEHRADVDADTGRAVQLGIRGVPFFVIDGHLALSGAQPPDAFVQALRHATTERDQRLAS